MSADDLARLRLDSEKPEVVCDEDTDAVNEEMLGGCWEAVTPTRVRDVDSNGYVILKEGYLIKQGHFIRNWKRRLFMLCDRYVKYYKGEELKGCINLEDIIKIIPKVDPSGRRNSLEIQTRKGKHFTLVAENSEARQKWIEAIREAREHFLSSCGQKLFVDLAGYNQDDDARNRVKAVLDAARNEHELVDQIQLLYIYCRNSQLHVRLFPS